jgi:hypothetical protein
LNLSNRKPIIGRENIAVIEYKAVTRPACEDVAPKDLEYSAMIGEIVE